jgi:hypothetical protein
MFRRLQGAVRLDHNRALTAACPCVAILPGMGVDFTLEVEGRVVSVPDPSGGECNAAGDFDALLPVSADLPTRHRVDVYGEVAFVQTDMAAIVEEAGEPQPCEGRSRTTRCAPAAGTRVARQPARRFTPSRSRRLIPLTAAESDAIGPSSGIARAPFPGGARCGLSCSGHGW